jgi:hypothetical protein
MCQKGPFCKKSSLETLLIKKDGKVLYFACELRILAAYFFAVAASNC